MAKFALYVSAVAGRLASRPGSPFAYIGARLTTPAERKEAEARDEEIGPAIWDEKQIVAITQREYLARPLDWEKLVANGDVLKRSAEEFEAYTKALEADEKKRDGEIKKAEAEAAAAKKKAEAEEEAKKKAAQGTAAGGGSQ